MSFVRHTLVALLVIFLFTFSTHDLHPVIGEKAPEIALPDINGDTLRLSKLNGKVVLIDFWASWCRSCRLENHYLKKTYSKYKDSTFADGKGFEIFSVSLDTDENLWKQAIINDKLNWTNHVSDLKKWDSQVVSDYNFKFLPHNVLINGEGRVIAKNLFKTKLTEFLQARVQ